MARNGSGTYAIPNTFTPATTIVAADVNENFDDLGDEITNSVAADGQTSMTGALKLPNGSNGSPALTFASDTDTGLYRDAANNPAISAGGTKVEEWTATLRTHIVPTEWPAEVQVASANTCDVLGAASDKVEVTGSTGPITSFGTGTNRKKTIRFASTPTITHNGTSLILPEGVDYTAAAGDVMEIQSDSSSNVRIISLNGRATAANFRANANAKLLSTTNVWASSAEVVLTDAATIAVDMSTFINARVTLTDNRTLGQPSNTKVGQSGVISIIQDATGSRTLAYHADWKFAGGTDPVLTTTANARDLLFYQVIAANVVFASLVKAIG
jgi:hypothetical protein